MLKHPFHEEMQELTVMVGGESCQPRRGWLPPHWKFAGKVLQLSRGRGSDPPFWCPVLFRVVSSRFVSFWSICCFQGTIFLSSLPFLSV